MNDDIKNELENIIGDDINIAKKDTVEDDETSYEENLVVGTINLQNDENANDNLDLPKENVSSDNIELSETKEDLNNIEEVSPVINTVAGDIPKKEVVNDQEQNDKQQSNDNNVLKIIAGISVFITVLFCIFASLYTLYQSVVSGISRKPILYLYPEKETNVKVKFSNNDLITVSYPKLNDSWNMKVMPNGDMYDSNGKYYYALYWEDVASKKTDFKEGFYVEGNDAASFLEKTLDRIGLNEREANEFIMYWLPILESNKKSLVYFELTEEKENRNKLIIEPKPDSMLRVTMHVKKVNRKVKIKEQKITTFNRVGFTAVEWGGMEY